MAVRNAVSDNPRCNVSGDPAKMAAHRCTEEVTFNGFPLATASKVLSTGAQTFWNIQNSGEHATARTGRAVY